MMRNIIIFVFSFLMSLGLCAQSKQAKLDSLFVVWQDSKQADSTRVNAFNDYIRQGFISSQPDSAFILAEQLVAFSKSHSYLEGEHKGYNLQGIAHYFNGEYAKAIEFQRKALNIAKQIGHDDGIASALNNLGIFYQMQGDYPKALEYYAKCIELKEKLGDQMGLISTLNNTGLIYNLQGNSPKALKYYSKSLNIAEELKNKKGVANAINNIGIIYKKNGDYIKALEFYSQSLSVYQELGHERDVALVLQNMGAIYREKDEFSKALDYTQQSLEISKKTGDKSGIMNSFISLGVLSEEHGDYTKALSYYNEGLKIAVQLGGKLGLSTLHNNIGGAHRMLGDFENALVHCMEGYTIAKSIGALKKQKQGCGCLYDTYKAIGNTKKALEYHEYLTIINDSLNADETVKDLQHMEFSKQMVMDSIAEVQEDLMVELAHKEDIRKKNRSRNIILGIGALVFLIAASLFWRLQYVRKSKATLQIEKDRSESLLLNILPEEIAEELKKNGKAKAQDIEKVTILFTDFKGFTAASSKLSAQDLVGEIGTCFEAFDHIMGKYDIEKIKTIGDAYMAASGLPLPSDDSIKNAVLAAMEMQAFITKRKINKDLIGEPAFEMRVGIHTGDVVAGIVGVKKFQYDIWGDTVNTASRMESNGEIGKVNISDASYQLIKADPVFKFEDRGHIEAKGKGKLKMWFVEKL